MERIIQFEGNLRYEIKVVDENTEEVIYTNSAYTMESLEEQDHKMQSAIKSYEEKLDIEKRQKELSQEFDRKYANGDFADKMILDDDLPDFKDNWISEHA